MQRQRPTQSDPPEVKALRQALTSGTSAAGTMVLQVLLFMPLDTTVTVQYRYGQSTVAALRSLSAHGYGRFYSGMLAALVQGPASRFGDTATNCAVTTYLNSNDGTKDLPTVVKTMMGSALASLWRVALMPLDVCKTVWQIYGFPLGTKRLRNRARHYGLSGFYLGSLASYSGAFCGHLPWYTAHNLLDQHLPAADDNRTRLLRSALVGFSSSVVSDCCTNSIKVLKAIRQAEGIPYSEVVQVVLRQSSLASLFTRGLQTRLATNGLQSIFFTVLWKENEQRLASLLNHPDNP